MKLVVKAADFAARGHSRQRRKGATEEPYINHPLEVAWILQDCVEAVSEEAVAAAILHDTIEDCGASLEELTLAFNERIAKLVVELSDDKSLPKDERKKRQIATAPSLSEEAKQIRIADKISNLTSLMTDPPKGWPFERILGYIVFAESVVQGCRGVSIALDARFDQTLGAVRQHYRNPAP
jgi:(p)ppGpp synthase/HD superfamily hydrolase